MVGNNLHRPIIPRFMMSPSNYFEDCSEIKPAFKTLDKWIIKFSKNKRRVNSPRLEDDISFEKPLSNYLVDTLPHLTMYRLYRIQETSLPRLNKAESHDGTYVRLISPSIG